MPKPPPSGDCTSDATVLDDIARLRAAGITNHQYRSDRRAPAPDRRILAGLARRTLATGVPHVSVYMLEVDEDSRLGREVMAGGTRYHAHFVPDEDATADFYLAACEQLEAAGIAQYEISNFAQRGRGVAPQSQILDAAAVSGLRRRRAFHADFASTPEAAAVRFATPDVLEKYVAGSPVQGTAVSRAAALEESFFLGLRLNRGVDVRKIAATFGQQPLDDLSPAIAELVADGLLQRDSDFIRLTTRGRLLSNEVFQAFLAKAGASSRGEKSPAAAFPKPSGRLGVEVESPESPVFMRFLSTFHFPSAGNFYLSRRYVLITI